MRYQAVLILAMCFASSLTEAGGQAGNGGDAVLCSPSPENSLRGLYSLDYLQTLGAGEAEVGTVQVKSWEESKNRILSALKEKAPTLAPSFQDFVDNLDNNRDWTKTRIWLPAPHGLVLINDQEIIRSLPKNCNQPDASGSGIDLIQTVIRIQRPGIIEYDVDLDTLVQLMNSPLQYSYLMVHEWLWDHADDVQSSRWANQLIHSDQLDKLSAEDLQKSLTNIGIKLPQS